MHFACVRGSKYISLLSLSNVRHEFVDTFKNSLEVINLWLTHFFNQRFAREFSLKFIPKFFKLNFYLQILIYLSHPIYNATKISCVAAQIVYETPLSLLHFKLFKFIFNKKLVIIFQNLKFNLANLYVLQLCTNRKRSLTRF